MTIDWDGAALAASPRYAALRPVLARLPAARAPSLAELNVLAAERGVTSGGGAPVRFVAAPGASADAPGASADAPGTSADAPGTVADYERRIHETGAVAMREASVHDRFNAMAWLAFPAAKAALNRLHCAHRVPGRGTRGTARDVLTLFDEDGLVMLAADASLAALLLEFRWTALFVERRRDVLRDARFLGFGHALHEKLLAPFRGLTAKVIVIAADRALLAASAAAQLRHADRALAARLADPATLASTRTLAPLPVLGIPGWAAENENPAYYADAAQFRPGRLKRALQATPR